jgi:5-methylcytosine-specific restriction endonuclease McrA
MIRKDITGKRYGRWCVVCHVAGRKWLCRCDCGSEKHIASNSLNSGDSKSCGCMRREEQLLAAIAGMEGKQFGYLTAETVVGKQGGHLVWQCSCVCGNYCRVAATNLKTGKQQSCGCYRRQTCGNNFRTHGLSHIFKSSGRYKQIRLERQRTYDNAWSHGLERQLRELQPTCVVCHATDNLSTDHVRPLSKGYGLQPGNAVRLCMSCNSQKHAKDLDELPLAVAEKIAAAAADFAACIGA